MTESSLYLSTVTPVFKAVDHLDQLVMELQNLRDQLAREGAPIRLIEAIFVDDGSDDGSAELLRQLEIRYSWVKAIYLSRNFGQHPATTAGILHSSGDWVVTLDEDLQHRPRFLIPLLKCAVEDSRDVVYARPEGPVHDSRFREFSSRYYKRFMSWVAGNPDIQKFNSFRLIRGGIARAAAAVASQETYFDIALSWFTKRIACAPVPLKDVRQGGRGRSGYSLRALLRHARRMLVSSQIKKLRLGGVIGIAALLISCLGAAATLFLKLVRPEVIMVRGWTSLILAIFFFGGLIALLSGIALEYISDLHLQALGRPNFFVVDRSKDETLVRWFRDQA